MKASQLSSANELIEYLWRVAKLSSRALRRVAAEISSLDHFFTLSETSLLRRCSFLSESAQKTLLSIHRSPRVAPCALSYCSFLEENYPSRLDQLFDPPCGFYHQGRTEILRHPRPWIAVVGTRKASTYALRRCEYLTVAMRPFDPVIVSGLALGIDGTAHRTAVGVGMKTLAVLGSSLENVYPPRHRDLAREIAASGLLLSEYAPGTPSNPWRFPERNRLIAALVDVLIVVEAPEKSGALITAQFALDLGREIYVVPGPADSPQNHGGHRLIQQGAKLLMEAEEIFLDLGWLKPEQGGPRRQETPTLSAEAGEGLTARVGGNAKKIMELLRVEALHVDKIIAMSHLPTPLVTSLLTQLSLEGLVEEMSGNVFGLRPRVRERLSKPQ